MDSLSVSDRRSQRWQGTTGFRMARFGTAIALSLPLLSIAWINISRAQNPSGPGSQQGTQIILNGKTIAVPWSYQWQPSGINPISERFSLSDVGLTQSTGVQLLNTDRATQQPIQWFSADGTGTANLPARLLGGYRLLDITDFARQSGWRIEISAGKLQIVAPAAKVLAVRRGKQSWGDRIVIELDRPATWQTDPQAQEFLINLDAHLDPAIARSLSSTPGTYLQSLSAESTGNQTRLHLGLSLSARPRLWSLANPDRIIVDVRPDSLVEQSILWAPGLRWRQQLVTLGTNQIPVIWLELNPRQPGLSLRPILPNPKTMMGTAPLKQTAQQSQAAAAINGGFFNRNRQLPLGAVRLEGRWFSGPILNRGAIAWDATGTVLFNRLTLQETLTTQTGQRLPITHLNSGYVQAGIARYTPDWGSTYTPLSDGEIAVTVQANQVINQRSLDKADTGSVPIPATGYLLILRSNRAAATALSPGTQLLVESTTTPSTFSRFPNILGAGPLLIQNRQIVLDAKSEQFSPAFATEAAARSAIARTAEGTLLLVTAHTHTDGTGLTLMEMAQLMQQLGAVDALNLDGGSSTTLYLGGQLLDRPASTAARVHDGIGVFVPQADR